MTMSGQSLLNIVGLGHLTSFLETELKPFCCLRSAVERQMGKDVGSVWKLWRYPVKSMLGEEVESANVVWSGFYGNRSYALVDAESSRLVSAKNPAKWGRMFECSSKLLDDSGADGRAPPVRVVLPSGESFDVADGNYGGAETALSGLFGRAVRFAAARAKPRAITIEQYHPEIEEDADGGKTTEYARPLDAQAGTFTDMAAVHMVTTASLKALTDLYPAGNFDPLRFRPNILIDTGEAKGFVEASWVGSTLAVGDEVRMKVYRECGRCVMTTLPQAGLPTDTGVLRTVMRFNRGKLGVFASVVRGGRVRRQDLVALL
jgi:uncharacterized protein YcbX